jgi:hypothetical protein
VIRLAVGLTLAGVLTAAALAGAVAAVAARVADLLPTRGPALDDQPAHVIATIAKETQP